VSAQRDFGDRNVSPWGLVKIPFDHDLRHTCAALLIAAGAHLEEIKDHLGHALIRTTSDRYGHLFGAPRERLRDHLDAMHGGFHPVSV
jgi:integrase